VDSTHWSFFVPCSREEEAPYSLYSRGSGKYTCWIDTVCDAFHFRISRYLSFTRNHVKFVSSMIFIVPTRGDSRAVVHLQFEVSRIVRSVQIHFHSAASIIRYPTCFFCYSFWTFYVFISATSHVFRGYNNVFSVLSAEISHHSVRSTGSIDHGSGHRSFSTSHRFWHGMETTSIKEGTQCRFSCGCHTTRFFYHSLRDSPFLSRK
jgi:hypothetical protein